MSQLEKLNHSAYQYYLANLPTFLDICQPLFDLRVKWFAYIKIFEDGYYLPFSTDEEFLKQYLLTIKSQGTTPTLEIESAPIGQNHYVMSPCNISFLDKRRDALIYLTYSYDIWHLYTIYKKRSEYIEAYTFGMNVADEYAAQFYLRNSVLLEHFCLYFNERTGDFIHADDRKKRGYFQQKFDFSNCLSEDKWAHEAEQFLLKTQRKRLTLQGRDQEVLISKRETECLCYLALGKSAKEIARDLSLSPRTIEFYLKNIKDKTGYTHKTQIISAYLKSTLKLKL